MDWLLADNGWVLVLAVVAALVIGGVLIKVVIVAIAASDCENQLATMEHALAEQQSAAEEPVTPTAAAAPTADAVFFEAMARAENELALLDETRRHQVEKRLADLKSRAAKLHNTAG